MQKRVRAVIIKDGKILTIKRFKNNETYYVFPGGGVEKDEDVKSALIRECLEEVNVTVEVGDLLYTELYNQDEIEFYLCSIVSGEVGVGSGEEYQNMTDNNKYEPAWLLLNDINERDIRPREIIDIIKKIK